VRPGDTVHAEVTIKQLIPEKRRVVMSTICTVGGKVVIEGDALVMPTSRRGLAVASTDLSGRGSK
ncbi:(R)-hydratase, partial [Rhizobium phaseoli]|nr:(R)-hydratase [Rhizobium phaseoli]